jgi:hypothetical protein
MGLTKHRNRLDLGQRSSQTEQKHGTIYLMDLGHKMGFFAHYEKHSDAVHRQVHSTGVLFLHHTDGICTVTV